MGDAGDSGRAFVFTGSGGEYFRIWSVNLLLSVVTLGIYSAWAKVRREQYFHRNTLLAGSGFDYHGSPLAILKGRFIAWGLVAVLALSEKFSPMLYGILVLALIPLLPWLLLRSLRFRAANTSYRGLRFRHRGTYGEAVAAFVGHGLLSVVTLGLWLPMWRRAMTRFAIGKLSYGTSDFACEPPAGGYYRTYLLAGLLAVAPLVVAGVLAATLTSGALWFLVPPVLLLGFALLVRPYVQVRLTNLAWNATTLGDCRFASNQTLGSFWPLNASNLLLTLLTLGLYWPWAKIREAIYRASRTSISAVDLDAFVAGAAQRNAAVGEEIADALDLEVAL